MTRWEKPRAAQRVQVTKGLRDWFSIANVVDDETAIYIYDEISMFGITAQDFVRELQAVKSPKIIVHLNSPGGDMFDGWAIYTALREHKAEVEIRVDALAASAASIIAMAGDRIVMAKPSDLMIHDAQGLGMGNAADFREFAEILDKFSDQIAGIYADRAGGSTREWRDRMIEETWYDQDEAVKAGIADEVAGTAKAKNSFDLSVFAHVPDHLAAIAARNEAPRELTKREVEAILRDAGLSKTQAMAVIAGGWPDDRRDSDAERLLATLRELTAV